MADGLRIPRSGWLALGSIATALAAGPDVQPTPLAISTASVPVIASIALRVFAQGRPRARAAGRIALLFGVGAVLLFGRTTLRGPVPAPGATDGTPSSTTVVLGPSGRRAAVVERVGSPKAAEQVALIRLGAGVEGSGPELRVEALLPRYPEVGPGDRIIVSGSVRPPAEDDFGAYLRRIGAAGSLRSPTLDLVAGSDGPQGLLDRVRAGSAEALTRSLPEPQAGLAAAILIGLRDRVDRTLAAAFTTAGVSHIVAISGWNIAIVAALVGALLRGRVGVRTSTLISLTAIIGYTLVAGASPSVNRAALMAAIGLTARAGGRTGPALAGLGWAVLALLLIDPATVTDPGFELSGLATAGLIRWAAPLTSRLRRIRGQAVPGWLAESLAISLAAEASTLPIVLLNFGRLALVAPLANLLIVPLVPPAMAASAVALAAGWLGAIGLPGLLVTLLGLPAWALVGLLIGLVRAAASLPFASVTLPPPSNIVAALAATAVTGMAVGGWRAFRGTTGGPVRVR